MTPGQAAYEAFWRQRHGSSGDWANEWEAEKEAWELAAQAAIAAATEAGELPSPTPSYDGASPPLMPSDLDEFRLARGFARINRHDDE